MNNNELREFIKRLDACGLLLKISDEIDWKYELGAVARKINKAILFENVKGYPGRKVFVNGLCSYKNIVLALGLGDENISPREVAKLIRQAQLNPIEPVIVKDSPVLENRITENIDLQILPMPWWNEKDAGRYLGTWHLNISRDPVSGVRNIGVYRMQFLGQNKATISVSPRSHLAEHIRRAEKHNRPLPMSVAIGVDERLIICAAAAPEYGKDELAMAGSLISRPLDIYRCITQTLEAPADAEIVIEGYIKPGIRVQDGPFLDYAGIININRNAHLFEATGLFFKSDYIFRGTAVGKPGAEDHQLYTVLAWAGLADFHGSRIRRYIQNYLLRHRAYRLFQYSGRIGSIIRSNN